MQRFLIFFLPADARGLSGTRGAGLRGRKSIAQLRAANATTVLLSAPRSRDQRPLAAVMPAVGAAALFSPIRETRYSLSPEGGKNGMPSPRRECIV